MHCTKQRLEQGDQCLRAGSEASENETVAIIYIEQYTAAVPSDFGVSDWIQLNIILWHYLVLIFFDENQNIINIV